jgi:hypothetical protein
VYFVGKINGNTRKERDEGGTRRERARAAGLEATTETASGKKRAYNAKGPVACNEAALPRLKEKMKENEKK